MSNDVFKLLCPYQIAWLRDESPLAIGEKSRRIGWTWTQALTEYNGTPIEVIDEDGDENAILGFDETCGNSAVTTSLYVYRPGSDTDGEFVQGLVGSGMIDHIDYGERNGLFDDLIEANMGLAMFHPRAACRIKGITNA